jgi:hypothetical protein
MTFRFRMIFRVRVIFRVRAVVISKVGVIYRVGDEGNNNDQAFVWVNKQVRDS